MLLPIAALPARDIGHLGKVAHEFLEHLVRAGQKIWQVLPVGPTIIHDSPFYSPSAFAISPNYIDLEDLANIRNLITQSDLEEYYLKFSREDSNKINYGLLWETKMPLLRRAYRNFFEKSDPSFQRFVATQVTWLEDYAKFMGIKEVHMNQPQRETWPQWEEQFKDKAKFDKSFEEFHEIARRNASSADITQWNCDGFSHWNVERLKLYRQVEDHANFHEFLQWIALEQWDKLKQAALQKGIRIVGDCPIYVAPDSADVWANREVFKLDQNGNQTCYAGVPPDYFSPKYGQFWGNPIYRWVDPNGKPNLCALHWWALRLKHQFSLFDELRIDHFRGFAGYWEIPANQCETKDETGQIIKTAKYGTWEKSPGIDLFAYVAKQIGVSIRDLPIIAEDLGVITDDVNQLREALNAPGMGVFQFAPWGEPYCDRPAKNYVRLTRLEQIKELDIHLEQSVGWQKLFYCSDEKHRVYRSFFEHEFLPGNATRTGKRIFYPGTHDNETIVGWFQSENRTEIERELLQKYLDYMIYLYYRDDPKYSSYMKQPLQNKVILYLSACEDVHYAIYQMQDILGLLNIDPKRNIKIRTNIPNQKGQWQWKMGGEHLFTREIQEQLSELTKRIPH